MVNKQLAPIAREQALDQPCAEALSYPDVLQAISQASLEFFESLETHDLKKFFQWAVDKMVELTHSQYGVIGEVLRDEQGLYLKEHGITDIAWNDEMRELFARYHAEGLEFHNSKSLFGEIIRTAQPLITDDAPNHPKASGVPRGHPPLSTFLGLPILGRNKAIIGIIGLANRPCGYSEQLVRELIPFAAMFAQAITVYRSEKHRKELQEALITSPS